MDEPGSQVAVQCGTRLAVVLACPSRDTVGHVMYVDRAVTGIAFGPAPWLGVGRDLGDANKFNLHTGATHRTDTHPGRTHHSWMLMSGFGPSEPRTDAAPAPAAPRAPAVAPSDNSAFLLAGAVAALVVIVVFLFATW